MRTRRSRAVTFEPREPGKAGLWTLCHFRFLLIKFAVDFFRDFRVLSGQKSVNARFVIVFSLMVYSARQVYPPSRGVT